MNIRKPCFAVILALSVQLAVCQASFADEDSVPEGASTITAMLAAATKTVEQYNSTGAYQIHADFAWSNKYTGKGVVVGVIDSGIDTASGEFGKRILRGYNAFDGSANVSDQTGHGTYVSGIIGASANGFGMIGVAPDVRILPIKVFQTESTTLSILTKGIDWSIGRAQIINMSLGSSMPFGAEQLVKNVAAGQLIVVAAGNDGGANPNWPARYASQTWANGQIIVVGAVDSHNVIASFSNQAGDAKNFFVVAPGVDILSTYPGVRLQGWTGTYANYGITSGTSAATPFVTGLAADIESLWPQLKANQVASIIFKTADHLGTSAVGTADSIYGWGLVNVAKALAPIGTPTVLAKSGTKTSVKTRKTFLRSRAAGSALLKAAEAGAFRAIALDDFGRQYSYDFGGAVVKQDTGIPLSQIFAAMDGRLKLIDAQLPSGAHMVATTMDVAGTSGQMQHMTSFAWTQKFAGGNEVSIGTANFAGQFFGLSDTPFATAGFAFNPLDNPYLSLANVQSYAGYGYGLGDGWVMKAGFMTGNGFTDNFASANGYSESAGQYGAGNAAGIAQIEKRSENGKFSLTASSLKESDSLLGGTSSGLFAIGNTTTLGVTASGAYRIGNKTWLAGLASYGVSSASGGSGIVSGTSGIETTAFSAGVMHQDAFRVGDSTGFFVSQPLKVVKGNLLMDKPVDVSVTGDVLFSQTHVNLAPTATEVDFETNYTTRLDNTSSISGAVIYRLNPGHDAKAADDAMFALRWVKEF